MNIQLPTLFTNYSPETVSSVEPRDWIVDHVQRVTASVATVEHLVDIRRNTVVPINMAGSYLNKVAHLSGPFIQPNVVSDYSKDLEAHLIRTASRPKLLAKVNLTFASKQNKADASTLLSGPDQVLDVAQLETMGDVTEVNPTAPNVVVLEDFRKPQINVDQPLGEAATSVSNEMPTDPLAVIRELARVSAIPQKEALDHVNEAA